MGIKLTVLQKGTASIRQLVNGYFADSLDKSLRLAECTALLCLHRLSDIAVKVLGKQFFRAPSRKGTNFLLQRAEDLAFTAMSGSIYRYMRS